MISTIAPWAFAGVAGVGLTTVLVLRVAGGSLPDKNERLAWIAWLIVAAGGVIGVAQLVWSRAPVPFGEALVASGVLMLAFVLGMTESAGRSLVIGSTIVAAIFMTACALALPTVAWRGVFGLVIFLTTVWLAVRTRGDDRRPLIELAVAPIAFAGVLLMLGMIRPSFVAVPDTAIGLLVVAGFATLGAATVIALVGTEFNVAASLDWGLRR